MGTLVQPGIIRLTREPTLVYRLEVIMFGTRGTKTLLKAPNSLPIPSRPRLVPIVVPPAR